MAWGVHNPEDVIVAQVKGRLLTECFIRFSWKVSWNGLPKERSKHSVCLPMGNIICVGIYLRGAKSVTLLFQLIHHITSPKDVIEVRVSKEDEEDLEFLLLHIV